MTACFSERSRVCLGPPNCQIMGLNNLMHILFQHNFYVSLKITKNHRRYASPVLLCLALSDNSGKYEDNRASENV